MTDLLIFRTVIIKLYINNYKIISDVGQVKSAIQGGCTL